MIFIEKHRNAFTFLGWYGNLLPCNITDIYKEEPMNISKKITAKWLALLMICCLILTGLSVAASVTSSGLSDNGTAAPTPDAVVPDANQYRYQKEELSAFCHFGPNTFNEIEWGESYGDRHPSEIFTLRNDFDAETFVKTLKEAGFQKLIVTAKHHDGFCIWDSKWTDYDVAASGYQAADGSSDILAEISAACTKYDMNMGLYLSPWDIHDPSYGYYDANGSATTAANDVLDYNEYYNNQLIEILSNDKYGNNGHFDEVWMDGAKGSGANAQDYDFVQWFNTIQKYEGIEAGYDADCMLFGAEAYTTVRWIGNELGYAAEETWSKSTVNYDNNTIDSNHQGSYTQGYENGNKWTVPEADARITSGWFWGTTKCTPKSIEDLATMYFNSVGHNSVLLLNIPPNNQGTVDKAILDRVTEFGNEIRETFDDNLAEGATATASEVRGNDIAYQPANVLDGDDATYWTVNDGTTTGTLTLDLGGTKVFDVVSIEEAIQFGQRITSFKVEYRNGDDDEWKTFDEGTTVGAKRLSRKAPVRADQIRITVTTSSAVPMLSEVGIYKASEGFELAGAMPAGMECIDITDSRFVLTDSWTHETGAQYTNGTNAWANGSTDGSVEATLTFTGTRVYIMGTVDSGHGEADIYIDGVKVATIDTNGSPRAVGQVIFESGDLTNGEHTLELICTESGKAIGIEAAYVINNGGAGMVGIENAEYTMNEDSEMSIKLVRVGGSTGSITVTLSPNPGSAIQDDFDTELIQVITFAEGETEKTALVRTTRNTNETGDQYFTVELTSDDDDVLLGLNTKATITILDTESLPDQYTTEDPFQFPSTVDASATLEADMATLVNSGGDSETWKLCVEDAAWAGNGKIINCLNRDDRIEIPYYAAVAGTYTVTVTYRSGSSTNYLAWYETNGKITEGSASAGNSDASVTMTATFEVVITEAGAGTWIFAPTSADSPQIDKFDITLTQIAS